MATQSCSLPNASSRATPPSTIGFVLDPADTILEPGLETEAVSDDARTLLENQLVLAPEISTDALASRAHVDRMSCGSLFDAAVRELKLDADSRSDSLSRRLTS